MEDDFKLRWHSHHSETFSAFVNLRNRHAFTDVTLSCGDGSIRAHKLILCACSAYFDGILSEINETRFPVLIFRDVSFNLLQLAVQFMYNGEVEVPSSVLPEFIRFAESLEIRGLKMNQERTTNSSDDPFDPQTALSRIQAFRNTFMSSFPQVGNLPFMMAAQQGSEGLGNVNVLAAAAAAAAMNQQSAGGKRRKNPNPVSTSQSQEFSNDNADWPGNQPKAIPLLKNIVSNSSPVNPPESEEVTNACSQAENGEARSPNPPENDRKPNHDSAAADDRGESDERGPASNEGATKMGQDDSVEDLTMPVDVRVDYDDNDGTYQSEDGMTGENMDEETNESWGEDEGYYKQDMKGFLAPSGPNSNASAGNVDAPAPDAPLHIPPEISPTLPMRRLGSCIWQGVTGVGRKHYFCSQCSYNTYAKSSIINHVRRHTGERPYGCQYCPKTFTQLASANRHKLTHINRNNPAAAGYDA